ncbi:polysaccharide biosynthesis tyrosine autokinase [Sanguibacter antarcticus]|uniref:non-specific protein-tyrosine kinase n=1 Tax=Sanguibacter antarcticus TaxID=372484 RepID=A0A2A9E2B7_9MICO|nr:polysaccharide biosynthesis tyrosine autokinase [Sanguibacter antarcticus]PFG33187.1 capsular exopolysaccharide synthesis family protein [Sanguibacter antarcticus]
MELQDYLAVLRKRWITIALVTALGIAVGAAATLLATPTYKARSQVFVSVMTGETSSDLLQGSSFTQKQVKSYTALVTSPRVLIPVIDELGLDTTPEALANSVSADSPIDTVLINITATNDDAELASSIANATAESLSTEVSALESRADGVSPVQISSVRTATVPRFTATPNTRLNLALGLALGLAVGVGIAVVRHLLDTRIRDESDVKQVTSSSIIASIAFDPDAPSHPLIVQTHPHSQRAEAFRRLRTNLQFLDVDGRPGTIVVTSSLPGEGKSTTAINLAMTLADAGSRVVLVDADLRRPSVARYMGLEGNVGLTTVLIGRATVAEVVQPWGDGNLHVLPSGQVPPNPSELLGSTSMSTLLDSLAAEYDVVLVDAPPLLPVTDAAILSRLAGGALVVVGADTLDRHQLAESMASLENVGARVLGLVLNRAVRTPSDAYAYYDYTPVDHDSTDAKKKNRGAKGEEKRSARPDQGKPSGTAGSGDVPRRMADADHRSSVDSVLSAADGSQRTETSPRTRPSSDHA